MILINISHYRYHLHHYAKIIAYSKIVLFLLFRYANIGIKILILLSKYVLSLAFHVTVLLFIQEKKCICLADGFRNNQNQTIAPSNCNYTCKESWLLSTECGGESAFNAFLTGKILTTGKLITGYMLCQIMVTEQINVDFGLEITLNKQRNFSFNISQNEQHFFF